MSNSGSLMVQFPNLKFLIVESSVLLVQPSNSEKKMRKSYTQIPYSFFHSFSKHYQLSPSHWVGHPIGIHQVPPLRGTDAVGQTRRRRRRNRLRRRLLRTRLRPGHRPRDRGHRRGAKDGQQAQQARHRGRLAGNAVVGSTVKICDVKICGSNCNMMLRPLQAWLSTVSPSCFEYQDSIPNVLGVTSKTDCYFAVCHLWTLINPEMSLHIFDVLCWKYSCEPLPSLDWLTPNLPQLAIFEGQISVHTHIIPNLGLGCQMLGCNQTTHVT